MIAPIMIMPNHFNRARATRPYNSLKPNQTGHASRHPIPTVGVKPFGLCDRTPIASADLRGIQSGTL